jgi:hypothetical protein
VESSGSGQGQLAVPCKHSNELTGSHKELLEQLSDCEHFSMKSFN